MSHASTAPQAMRARLRARRPALARVRAAGPSRPQTELSRVSGFLVVDPRGRLVGRVEGPTFAASNGTPAALTVSFGFLWLRRCVVSAGSIEQIDDTTRVVGLRVGRGALRAGRA
jgi:hypothetical protein